MGRLLGALFPGRPPSKTKGIRRVLRLRSPRFRTPPPAVRLPEEGRPRLGSPFRSGSAALSFATACGGVCARSSGGTARFWLPRDAGSWSTRGPSAAWGAIPELREDYDSLLRRALARARPAAPPEHGSAGARVAVACSPSTSGRSRPSALRLPLRADLFGLCAGGHRAARLPSGEPARRLTPLALPPVPSRRPRPGALGEQAHGKTASLRGRAFSGDPDPLGVGRAQAGPVRRASRHHSALRPRRPAPSAAADAGRVRPCGDRRGHGEAVSRDARERRRPRHVLQPRRRPDLAHPEALHGRRRGRPLELVRACRPGAPRRLRARLSRQRRRRRNAPVPLSTPSRRERNADALFRFADGALASHQGDPASGPGYLFDVKMSVAGPALALSRARACATRRTRSAPRPTSCRRPRSPRSATGLSGSRRARSKRPSRWPLPERGFAGLEDNYFLTVLIPRQPATARVYPVAVPAASREGDGRGRGRA